MIAFLGGISFLLSQGIDLRPNLAAVLGLAFADSVFLGGSCLAQISSYWPPNRRRILIHEAGHLLIGKHSFFLIRILELNVTNLGDAVVWTEGMNHSLNYSIGLHFFLQPLDSTKATSLQECKPCAIN